MQYISIFQNQHFRKDVQVSVECLYLQFVLLNFHQIYNTNNELFHSYFQEMLVIILILQILLPKQM